MSQGNYNIEAKISRWSMIAFLFRHIVNYIVNPWRMLTMSTPKYYVSIHDCPIGVFQNILQGGNYSLLCYDGKLSEEELNDIWFKIYDEYIRAFGVPELYSKLIKLRIKWGKEQERIWIKGDKYRESFAAIYKHEAEELTKGIKDEFHEALAYISKSMGFRVDPKVVTVYEFYGYVKALEKNGKQEG